LETLKTGHTGLKQDKQELTEENTKLKEQVEIQDGQLQDLKGHQTQLVEENTQLKSQNEALTQQLQTLITNQGPLAQDKKALQDENADLKSQLADLRRQLQNQPPLAQRPTTKKWNTNESDDTSWVKEADRFSITTAELFRLNYPEINASTQFHFNKLLNVPSVTKPGER
jgi:regulator of replication initiation timing